jgi:hypothetical protein
MQHYEGRMSMDPIPAVSARVDAKFLVAYRRYYRLDQELGECNRKDEKLGVECSPETSQCADRCEAARNAIEDRFGVNTTEYFFGDGGYVAPDSAEFYKSWEAFRTSEDWTGGDSRPVGRPTSEFSKLGWMKKRLADVYEIPDAEKFLDECAFQGITRTHAQLYLGQIGFSSFRSYRRFIPDGEHGK